MRLATIIGAICVIIFVACNSNFSTSDFVGDYVADFNFGSMKLKLSSDGTYQQIFKYSSGKTLQNSGTWIYRAKEPLPNRIRLYDAMMVYDSLGEPAKRVERLDWEMIPEGLFRVKTLKISSFLEVEFRKDS